MNKNKRLLGAFVGILAALSTSTCTRPSNEIPIGVILVLTGDAAVYGVPPQQGIELAIEEVNASAGVGEKKIRLIVEDDQCSPTAGVSAFHKITSQHRPPAILGAICSSVTSALVPLADSNRVVLFSPQSSAPTLTGSGKFFFRNWPSDTIEGKTGAEFAYGQLGARSAAVLYITNDYGAGVGKVFEQSFASLGGKVVLSEGFPAGTTDFRTQLAKARALRPDVIYLASYLREAARLLVQRKEARVSGKIIGPIGLLDPELLSLTGPAAEGLYVSASSYDPESGDPHVQRFVAAFKAKFGDTPNAFAATGYDAAHILVRVMREVGLDSEAIRKGLHDMKDYPGVSGSTSFDSSGDVVKPARMLVVEGGAFKPVQAKKTP